MKTLGDLKVGDPFYLIEYDEGGFICDVTERTVSIIKDISVGMIIKFFNNDGDLEGFTIEKSEFNSLICTAYYLQSCCADLDFVKETLENNKKDFIKRYNRLLETLNKL